MPYIKQVDRARFLNDGEWASNVGELNFNLTMILGIYGPSDTARILFDTFIDHYVTDNHFNYQIINDVMGVLACMVPEITRRRNKSDNEINLFIAAAMTDFYHDYAVPYEDQKMKVNGDLEVFQATISPNCSCPKC